MKISEQLLKKSDAPLEEERRRADIDLAFDTIKEKYGKWWN